MLDKDHSRWRQILGIIFLFVTVLFGLIGFFSYIENSSPTTQSTLPTSSSILLLDNFDNAKNNQGYNPDLWSCDGCEAGTTTYENDSIRFEVNSIGHIDVLSTLSFPSDQVGYIQGKLKLSMYDGEKDGDVHLALGTKISSGWWAAMCWIAGRRESTVHPEYLCTIVIITNSGEEKYEYFTQGVNVNYGEWYTSRIELNPDTFEFRFYLEDKLIGGHVPSDAKELNDKYMRAYFGISSNNHKRHIIAYMDDVLVSKSP